MPDRDNPKPPRRSPARAAPPRAAPPTPGGVPDLTARLEQLIAENAALKTKADHLEAQLRDAARELETLRPKVEELTARAARFEAEAAQTKQYQQERDEARRALDTLRAEQDRMIADAVRTALQAAETRHAAELAQIVRERDELKARLGATQPRLTEIPDSETTPSNLATSLATVLDKLGDGLPTDKNFRVALSGLEVEARGVLKAPSETGGEPTFTTIDPRSVPSGQLSLLRMQFRTLPRITTDKDDSS